MKRLWLTAVMGLFTLGLLAQCPALASTTLTLSPEADTYVNMNLATTNFGTNSLLYVGRNNVYARNSLLRFDLTALSGIAASDLLSATLYLDIAVLATNKVPIAVSHVDNDAWLENTVTWNTRPPLGSTMYTSPSNPPIGWLAFNLLSAGNGWVSGDLTDGLLSVALSTALATGTYVPNQDYKFYSRDYADSALRPYLTVEYNNPVPLPPTVLLLGSGLLGVAGLAWRRNKA